VFDTVQAQVTDRTFRPGARYPLQGRSVAVFKAVPPVRERRGVGWHAQAGTTHREPALAHELRGQVAENPPDESL
jgi:hypothetical protein